MISDARLARSCKLSVGSCQLVCGRIQIPLGNINNKEKKKMVKKINAEQFENEARKSAAALIDFSATWCGPCRMLAPVLEEISDALSGKADFFNVDVDESPALAQEFGVSSIPCLVLLKNGRPVSQSVGFRPAGQIREWIEGNL